MKKIISKNILKDAGVLLIALVMGLSTVIVAGNTTDDMSEGLEGGLKLSHYSWSITEMSADSWEITDSPNPVGLCADPVYVDDSWAGTPIGDDPDGGGPAQAFGTDAFDNIQDGVNAVDVGGTVHVYAGDYSAGIVINKDLEVIGEDGAGNTFIDLLYHAGDIYGVQINHKAKCSGFTIRLVYDLEMSTTTLTSTYGIRINADNCHVHDNTITEVDYGIFMSEGSCYNEIYRNDIVNSLEAGIWVGGGDNFASSYNEIYNNHMCNLTFKSPYGIRVCSEIDGPYNTGNKIYGNAIEDSNCGIAIASSRDTEIYNNLLNGNHGAIEITSEDYSESINNEVHDNLIEFNELGVGILKSTKNQVFNNLISENTFGVLFDHSESNTIENNDILSSIQYGIWLNDSHDNIIYKNNVGSNAIDGIIFNVCDNNKVYENHIWKNGYGIYLGESDVNDIHDNIFSYNQKGIYLESSNENVIFCNIILKNNPGMEFHHSKRNQVYLNTIRWNIGIAIFCTSNNNRFYHNNFFDNSIAAYDNCINFWDDGSSEGNYWSLYTQKYPSAINNGHVWNIPYILPFSSGNSKDKYPLVKPCINQCNYSSLIEISKDDGLSGGSVKLGETITYTIYYKNPNAFTLHNVVIIDYLPEGTTYVQNSANPIAIHDSSMTPETLTWNNIADLLAHGSGTVSFKVEVVGDDYNVICNEVFIYSDETHPAMASVNTPFYDPDSNPNIDEIDGITNGKAGKEYSYTLTTTDPDGDDVYYFIEWGDGQVEEWFGPYSSGETATVKHTWTEQGTYTIRAKAKDTNGLESVWASLEVSMPKNKLINTPFLQLLENHPRMFLVLRHLLGL